MTKRRKAMVTHDIRDIGAMHDMTHDITHGITHDTTHGMTHDTTHVMTHDTTHGVTRIIFFSQKSANSLAHFSVAEILRGSSS